jgi:hypothetical protein
MAGLVLVLLGCGSGDDGLVSSSGDMTDLTPHTVMTPYFGDPVCARCHTEQGATSSIGLVNGTEGPEEIETILSGMPDIADPSPVACGTCHDRDTGTFLGERAQGLPASWSVQFKTCTACHQLYKADGTTLNTAYHDSWSADKIITDTHWDDPNTDNIEGYVINTSTNHVSGAGNANVGTCLDCHDPHNPAPVRNREWARSAHGGFIGEVGVVTEQDAAAWVHYDFKTPYFMGWDPDCQRCHTATGFRNLANNPALYNSVNNVFTAHGKQRELLYCWACHIDNRGGLRDPGIFNGLAPYSEPADRINAVPDVKGSNICMACHIGRLSGEAVKALVGNFPISGTDFGSYNSHYLAAGGILYRTVGYEYAGKDYTVSYFKHNHIGVDVPGTGANGPCVGCHMQAESVGHTLSPVKEDATGRIVEIPANAEICSNCHMVTSTGDHRLTLDIINGEKRGFLDALDALQEAFEAKNIYYSPDLADYPYFYDGPVINNTPHSDWQTEGTLGAAFNLNLLRHEPGAYVHNRQYTKMLVYDCLDFMQNGGLTNSVDLTGHYDAYVWLLPYGSTAPITAVGRQ